MSAPGLAVKEHGTLLKDLSGNELPDIALVLLALRLFRNSRNNGNCRFVLAWLGFIGHGAYYDSAGAVVLRHR